MSFILIKRELIIDYIIKPNNKITNYSQILFTLTNSNKITIPLIFNSINLFLLYITPNKTYSSFIAPSLSKLNPIIIKYNII